MRDCSAGKGPAGPLSGAAIEQADRRALPVMIDGAVVERHLQRLPLDAALLQAQVSVPRELRHPP